MLTVLRREWRSDALKMTVLALIIAVASMSSVAFFTDRLQRGLDNKRYELLGGDYALRSDNLISSDLIQLPASSQIQKTQYLSFLSMVSTEQGFQLANIKAVDQHYPLLGEVELSTGTSRHFSQRVIPKAGQVWVNSQLLTLLKAQIGDLIQVGNCELTISHVLENEPDRGERWFSIAPKLMMNYQDIDKTGVIVPGSRLLHQVMFTGDPSELKTYITALSSKLSINEKVISAENYQPMLSRVLERTRHYLELATLLTLLLSSIAISIALMRYLIKRQKVIALMRCFGSTLPEILLRYFKLFCCLGLFSCVIGCILGYLGQIALSKILVNLLQISLPPARFLPALWASLSGFILYLGIVLPLIASFKNITPMSLMRQIQLSTTKLHLLIGVIVAVILLALLTFYTQDVMLTLWMSSAIAVIVFLLWPINRAIIYMLNLSRDSFGLIWQFSIANIYRNRKQSAFELLMLSLIITVLLLVVLVRNDIISQWQETPKATPNYFLINISPDEVTPLTTLFNDNDINTTPFYPMVRGRLISLNGKPILEALPEEKHIHNALNRALNFSWANTPPLDSITSGVWWGAKAENTGEKWVSLEEGLAQQLGFQLGDTIGVQIGSQTLEVTIANFRKVTWRSFQPNFYMLFPQPVLAQYPKTFISSIHIPNDKQMVLRQLNELFPAVTMIDTASIAEQFKGTLDSLAAAFELIMIFMVIAVMLILISTLITTLDYRTRQHAIIRALGGSERLLKNALMLEFALLGVIAGTIATGLANLLGSVFAIYVLEFEYTLSLSIWLLVPLLTGFIILLLSYAVERKTLRVTPAQALKL